jgi:electron transport complex protein RnfB
VNPLAARIHSALPQTQCTRCGFPDCAGYAEAIAQGQAQINQCPPGGAEGIARLSSLTGRPPLPLDPANGREAPRFVAVIDEAWCIGCTLCLPACPTDAIVGSNKLMHTVVEPWCTGCELCVAVCPVDCIGLENVTGERTGWQAWSPEDAAQALGRYEFHRSKALRSAAHRRPSPMRLASKRRRLAQGTRQPASAPSSRPPSPARAPSASRSDRASR